MLQEAKNGGQRGVLAALVVVVLGVVVWPGVALAYRHGHYVGHTSCGDGSRTCPRQHSTVLLTVRDQNIRNFSNEVLGHLIYGRDPHFTSVTCRIAGSSRTEAIQISYEKIERISIGRDGYFRKRVSLPFQHDHGHATISGRVQGSHVRGKIDLTRPAYQVENSDGSISSYPQCKARGIELATTYRPDPLFALGHYSGTATCRETSEYCLPQSNPITFTATRSGLTDVRSHFSCQTAPAFGSEPRDYDLYIAHVAIDWAGFFWHDGYSPSGVGGELLGRLRSTSGQGDFVNWTNHYSSNSECGIYGLHFEAAFVG